MTWLERLQQDDSLQAFVSAEIVRAGIRVHVLELEHQVLLRQLATLRAERDAARDELRTLRRRVGRQHVPFFDEAGP